MIGKITSPGLFRLFLALMVFVHHTTQFSVGTSAVYIFFCLSGFWIQKMWTGRYSATRQPYFTYMVSRLWRLLPTFWLVTLLTLLVVRLNGSTESYWSGSSRAHLLISNLLIVGYYGLRRMLITPAWSLDMEMQFYVVAPIIAIILARRKVNFIWLLAAAAVISAASSILHSPIPPLNFIVYFVIGMVAASTNWHPSGKMALVFLGATVVLVAGCVVTPLHGVLFVGAHPGPLAVYTPYANIAIAVLMIPYAIFTTAQKGPAIDGMFADLSYIIYLLHWAGTTWINAHPGTLAQRLHYLAVGWALVIGSSLIIWKIYDHPINRMRSQWVSSRKKTVAVRPRIAEEARTETAT